mgnify:CR=1 FL=1|jgi:hypothetical protein
MAKFPGLNIGKDSDIGNLMSKNILGGKSFDKFRTGGNGTAGDSLLLMQEEELSTESAGVIGNTEGESIKAAPSRFNPFNVFRYRQFGLAQGAYDLKKHSDTNLYGASEGLTKAKEGNIFNQAFNYISNVPINKEDDLQPISAGEYQKTVRNPTAAQIIEHSRNIDNSNILGPTPFAYNDFIFCTHYGKIPNNRLVALRRYPQPVEDSLINPNGTSDEIKVPLAQALAYYGEGTGNDINTILPMGWDMKWIEKEANVQDITGNEILVDDVIAGAGVEDETIQKSIRAGVASQRGNLGALEVAGYDKKLQDYIKGAYKSDGPYWNRVLGPVNVINKNRMRDRGMGSSMFNATIKVKFSYTLRSFNFINPRIAFLDMLSNILTLTYNTAPFWGGGYRYFKNPGVTISSAGSELIEQGRVIEGIALTLNEWLKTATGATKQLLNQVANVFEAETGGTKSEADDADLKLRDASGKITKQGKAIFNVLAAGRASALMQAPLSYRSLLEGRPVGEWHMTIGNPLDPMAVMGNLVCTNCDMKFSNELGADDFPKSVDFTVTLQHGRPRAKQDIESMFNLGGGPMSFSKLKPPSSTKNTFATEPKDLGKGKRQAGGVSGESGAGNIANMDEINTTAKQSDVDDSVAGDGINIYRGRVTTHYGKVYGASSMLEDYISKTAT